MENLPSLRVNTFQSGGCFHWKTVKLLECDFQTNCLTIFIGKNNSHVGRRLHAPKRESTIHFNNPLQKKNGTSGRVVLQFLLGTTTIPTLKKLFSENTPISNNYKSRECISLEVTLSTLNLKNKYVRLHMYIYTQCLDCWVSDKTSIRSISIYSSYGRCRYGSLPQNLNTNIYRNKV